MKLHPLQRVGGAGQLAVAKDQRDGWVLVEVFSYAPEQSVVGWLPAWLAGLALVPRGVWQLGKAIIRRPIHPGLKSPRVH